MKRFTPHLVLVKAIQISRRRRCHRSTELTPSFRQLGSSAASFTWPKKKGTASRNIFHIYDLPFFQRVFGKQSGEIRIASMKDCVSVWIQQLRKSAHLANLYLHVGINASEVILQPSPTLFKGSTQFKGGTHNHSTPRLQLPSLELSSCTPCNAPFLFLGYEELDQAAVDLCADISTR